MDFVVKNTLVMTEKQAGDIILMLHDIFEDIHQDEIEKALVLSSSKPDHNPKCSPIEELCLNDSDFEIDADSFSVWSSDEDLILWNMQMKKLAYV